MYAVLNEPLTWILIQPMLFCPENDLDAYHLQYRLPKNISRWESRRQKLRLAGRVANWKGILQEQEKQKTFADFLVK